MHPEDCWTCRRTPTNTPSHTYDAVAPKGLPPLGTMAKEMAARQVVLSLEEALELRRYFFCMASGNVVVSPERRVSRSTHDWERFFKERT